MLQLGAGLSTLRWRLSARRGCSLLLVAFSRVASRGLWAAASWALLGSGPAIWSGEWKRHRRPEAALSPSALDYCKCVG